MGSALERVNALDTDLNKSRGSKNNAIKDTPARVIFKIFNYLILAVIGFVCLVPLWHILMLSFSNPVLIQTSNGIVFWPLGGKADVLGNELNATLQGYRIVLANKAIVRGYANTIFYVGAGCFFSILFSSVGAYCVSRKALFSNYIILFIMVSMFLQGGMIPTYMVYKSLGMVNTRWIFIINGLMSVMNIILLMMAFRNMPPGLEESAQLDGAGHLTLLFKISMPLVKSTVAVLALFYAIAKWQDYITSQIYIKDPNLYPLQIILRQILLDQELPAELAADVNSQMGARENTRELVEYATTIVGTLPLLCIYPFIQKYFVKGIMIGSIKG
ncbi:MAG: carbohydrate ABC transporter permease [Oscillospiraceae bacterium]|jgi:putative aldouronate transport system permease protein|nr:carbohydrate ABC transporter permease [Oscillospiraceae bacterium]